MSIFTQVALQKPRFNTFDLSHDRKFSGLCGQLIPCFIAETVPNDTFDVQTSQLIRFVPMVAPVMHRFSCYVHFFYVPNRILWDGWEDFINGGEDGEENPAFPFLTLSDLPGALDVQGLSDYLGIPVPTTNDTRDLTDFNVSALPFAVYQKIWYDYYRDQNQFDESWNAAVNDLKHPWLVNGDNTAASFPLHHLRYRAWQHDYFTSALPWTQRGPQATIPLGTSAPLSSYNLVNTYTDGPTVVQRVDNSTFGNVGLVTSASTLVGLDNVGDAEAAGEGEIVLDITGHTELDPAITADLSAATAATINDLRRAFRLQEWLELNARAGSRYNETIRAHFGIDPGDARLQRSIFLGGSATPIVISEVLQTNETTETSPQGNMAGHGVSIGGKNIMRYKCREHGFIMGIMSVMPKSAYQQGVPKFFLKFDRFDYFWKSFANIGEQAIYNWELYTDDDGNNDEVFGYIPRYAEYKYLNDSVHGAFRDSLDFWHAGRIFANRPQLNDVFVSMLFPEVSRIFAVVDNTEHFYVQMHHKVKARRPMPYFGTPTI